MSSDEQRAALIQALTYAVYDNSTMAVFFHTAIAQQIGLGATEEKALLILSGGALTAGEIAQQTGLTTASVTSLIDRLEAKGFVRRVRDTNDRRRVIVEPIREKLNELMNVFGSFQGIFDDLLNGYSDDQIVTITDFLKRAADRSRKAIDQLKQEAARDSAENTGD